MSIEITSKNLSKFHKKLKNALSEMFPEQSISLSQSAELFAKASGFRTAHDLQNILTNSQPKNNIAAEPISQLKAEFIEWFEDIERRIKLHLNQTPNTLLHKWTWGFDDCGSFLNVQFLSGEAWDETWSFYLNGVEYDSTESILQESWMRNIDPLKHKKDLDFLKEIEELIPLEMFKNGFFQKAIKEKIKSYFDGHSFIRNPELHSYLLIAQKNPQPDYAYATHQDYIIVKDNNCSFSYDHSSEWIEVENVEHIAFQTLHLNEALKKLEAGAILIERVWTDEKSKAHACLYITQKEDGFIAHDISEIQEKMFFKQPDSLLPYRAKQAFQRDIHENPYFVNQGEFWAWTQEMQKLNYVASLPNKKNFKFKR